MKSIKVERVEEQPLEHVYDKSRVPGRKSREPLQPILGTASLSSSLSLKVNHVVLIKDISAKEEQKEHLPRYVAEHFFG